MKHQHRQTTPFKHYKFFKNHNQLNAIEVWNADAYIEIFMPNNIIDEMGMQTPIYDLRYAGEGLLFVPIFKRFTHKFHLVTVSPWPILGAFSALILTFGSAMYMHDYDDGRIPLLGLVLLVLCMIVWWRDVIREGTYEGVHTKVVQRGLRIGMILFIISEIMFFFGFFWAFFHSSLVPTVEIGGIWPPYNIRVLDPWEIPFLNTLILLLSGVTVTYAHHAIRKGALRKAIRAMRMTLILAVAFTSFQLCEYLEATFTISDGIYGSTFYMATGFHGFHVIIGTLFLTVTLKRLRNMQLLSDHHVGFEAAAWYWHFVDVVWIFLFTTIYYWSSI